MIVIVFKSITYKNFMSTGEVPITIQLNKHKTTQIVGISGSGKSTLSDALCFVLFNKPFRNINKPNLCNSINGKNCLVEISFSIGNNDYKVIRGIKPNIFQIFKNNVLINQDAASRDYQKVLETQILRMNYKVFCQVVILGSASFTPFMQLPAASRREIIEDILDIRIFSIMNSILKTKIQINKDELMRIEEQIKLLKVKANAQQKLISTIETTKNNTIERLEHSIEDILNEITQNEKIQNSLQNDIQQLKEHSLLQDEINIKKEHQKLLKNKNKIEGRINELEKMIQFLKHNKECPNCNQSISDHYKNSKLTTINNDVIIVQKELTHNSNELELSFIQLEKINELKDVIIDKNQELSNITNNIVLFNRQISKLNKEIQDSKHDTSNIEKEKNQLKQFASEAVKTIERKSFLLEEKKIHDISILLLKDSGIKTSIIREYLPLMNKLINYYLQSLDLFIQFELDESFSEVIKSRYRDEFSYNSFSEGEKARINLSILFAWREIARMKNSVNTNLLFMDETLDNSLDDISLEYVMNLLSNLREGTNLFVISHRNTHSDRFQSIIKIEKRNEFSYIL